ncbi:GTP pyrophosphokinase [Nocardia salmonicida]|uniref:GTP pyrophosphokinase n=1 Tax=Nocardia salmonicida TaxID=53431 RepID=UPI003438D4E3
MTAGSGDISWGVEYDAKRGQYEELRGEVEFALRRALEGINTHNIVVRLKDRKSFIEKIERKSYDDPFGQMPDIVGARVVCRFLDDITLVDSTVREIFTVAKVEDKTASAAPETFAYRSVHYECRIRDDNKGPHYDSIKEITFEIQVRTILQDAWAVVEHALAYKGLSSIPPELRRDFSALVGLFHIADKSFQQLRYDVEKSERKATEVVGTTSERGDDSAEATNSITLDRGIVKAVLTQKFPDHDRSDDLDYSALVDELSAAKIHTLGDLSQALGLDANQLNDLFELEIRNGPYPDDDGNPSERFSDVGFLRFMLSQTNPEFKKMRGRSRRTIWEDH